MNPDDYFDFLSPDDIRIKGTRVGIETVLNDYLKWGKRPEEIAASYLTLELDQVYATILYYLRNREAIDCYMDEWREWGRRTREEQALNPPPVVARLRELKARHPAGQPR